MSARPAFECFSFTIVGYIVSVVALVTLHSNRHNRSSQGAHRSRIKGITRSDDIAASDQLLPTVTRCFRRFSEDDSCLGGRFDAAVEQATDIDIAEHVDRRAAAIEEPVHGDRPHASVGQAWLKA